MILETLILENVGVYAGRQEADLAPLPGKPVILFGGLNGGGKTTILESLQLAFYGAKARLASRGATAYKDYLREAIHRGSNVSEGAAITVRFRRIVEGETRQYEVRRSWRMGAKGLEETLLVWRNGESDALLTENWGDYIEGYLPSGIAHLFFFDGEQIKDLAEGNHAAEILGTAIQTLLGLDIVDRLESNLKVLERRKRAEVMTSEVAQEMARLQEEIKRADGDQEAAMHELRRLTNEVGALAKELRRAEEIFKREGGDTFAQRYAIEEELRSMEREHAALGSRLRELASGPAPLLLVGGALADLERTLRHDVEIKTARLLLDTLAIRDKQLLAALTMQEVPAAQRRKVAEWMTSDREKHEALAAKKPELHADPQLVFELAHLRSTVLPQTRQEIANEVTKLNRIDEALAITQAKLERVPAAETVAKLQQALDTARASHQAKVVERATVELRVAANQRNIEHLERQMSQLGFEDVDQRFASEDLHRLLKHAEKVRGTLAKFRTAIIRKHTSRLESLILESFQQLLRKSQLVTALRIDPETFAVTLTGSDGQPLPFNRLSAGERQLLATSLLWGLARASGRPIPTIIDTPLGRLDSSHRHHLVERYFPVASHQIILLSTDEEIAEEYHDGLKPYVARQFLLTYDEKLSCTSIVPDQYFAANETAR
ncbi:MAG: DNA sulfur modification protein DndD [Gammaproteobacteria bacterium]|nr:DNA sulfur modification protein DndD [Gammaproteobacteria bacterium]